MRRKLHGDDVPYIYASRSRDKLGGVSWRLHYTTGYQRRREIQIKRILSDHAVLSCGAAGIELKGRASFANMVQASSVKGLDVGACRWRKLRHPQGASVIER